MGDAIDKIYAPYGVKTTSLAGGAGVKIEGAVSHVVIHEAGARLYVKGYLAPEGFRSPTDALSAFERREGFTSDKPAGRGNRVKNDYL